MASIMRDITNVSRHCGNAVMPASDELALEMQRRESILRFQPATFQWSQLLTVVACCPGGDKLVYVKSVSYGIYFANDDKL